MKPLHALMGFVAVFTSAAAVTLHSTSALAGKPEELNAYNFPVSKVAGIPGSCRMIQTGSSPEREAECAEWGRKFRERVNLQHYDSSSSSRFSSTSSRASSTSRRPVQTLSCYTSGGVYSNLGDCR